MKNVPYLLALIVLVVGLSSSCNSNSPSAITSSPALGSNSGTAPNTTSDKASDDSSKADPQASRPLAPDFELTDLKNKRVKLSQYRGKVVVLNFWATWCPPCRKEIPDFIETYSNYREKGVEFLGIALDDEGKEVVAPFVSAKNINYPILIGEPKVVSSYGGIEAVPTTFLIDREGRVQFHGEGAISRATLEKVLDKMLAQ